MTSRSGKRKMIKKEHQQCTHKIMQYIESDIYSLIIKLVFSNDKMQNNIAKKQKKRHCDSIKTEELNTGWQKKIV